jgi:hypothetical protein
MQASLPAAHLRSTLSTMASLVGRVSGDAAWTFDDGALTVEWAGGSATFPGTASGVGAGTVRVRGPDMVGLAAALDSSPGAEASTVVRASGGRLFVGGFSVEGLLLQEPDSTVPQLLPVDPSLRDVLRLPVLHSAERIAAAGLTTAAQVASQERALLVRQALAILAPMGVTVAALDACVDACLAGETER